MIRFCAWTMTVGLMTVAAGGGATRANGAAEVRTMTGWFSDAQCAAPRVKKGIIAMNNPDCVKKCLKEGVAAVFISEQAKAMFEVRGYPTVADDVGWHVEVTGTIDATGQAIDVQSVKRLSEEGATCALPRKKPSGTVAPSGSPSGKPSSTSPVTLPSNIPAARSRTSAGGR